MGTHTNNGLLTYMSKHNTKLTYVSAARFVWTPFIWTPRNPLMPVGAEAGAEAGAGTRAGARAGIGAYSEDEPPRPLTAGLIDHQHGKFIDNTKNKCHTPASPIPMHTLRYT